MDELIREIEERAKGYTRAELAKEMLKLEGVRYPSKKKVHFKVSWIGRLFAGEYRPRLDNFINLAKTVNFSVKLEDNEGC